MSSHWWHFPVRLAAAVSSWRGAAVSSWRGAAVYGALVVTMAGGLPLGLQYIPGPPLGAAAPVRATAVAAFRQIIMPDLVVIARKGLDAAHLASLSKIRGMRNVLAVDGATITVKGRTVNLLGVDAQRFRSWTPLSTASNQRLWSSLDNGGFVASVTARHRLKLEYGATYQLSGGARVSLPFGGAATLGLTGIDLVVSNRVSSQLGLIHNVATLMSAPGVAIPRLRREVRAALGPGATLITLRREQQQPLPVERGRGIARPATYLDLFKESAARFCPGLSWTVLAAIGQIESGDGTNMGPSSAGALGPMQFLPSTWKVWGIAAFGEPEPPNIMDPYDAVPSAARYLCAAGASSPSGLARAIYAYNHATWYVNDVLALARQYAQAYG